MADEVPPFRFIHRLSREDFADLSEQQRGMITSIRSLDPTLQGPALKQRVAELFPPAVLFGPNIQNLSGINAELRDFLNKNGCNLAQHPSRKIVNTSHMSYTTRPKSAPSPLKWRKRSSPLESTESLQLHPLILIPTPAPATRLANLKKGSRTTWQ